MHANLRSPDDSSNCFCLFAMWPQSQVKKVTSRQLATQFGAVLLANTVFVLIWFCESHSLAVSCWIGCTVSRFCGGKPGCLVRLFNGVHASSPSIHLVTSETAFRVPSLHPITVLVPLRAALCRADLRSGDKVMVTPEQSVGAVTLPVEQVSLSPC